MQDHPIEELKDMRGEFHANPHTRMAIVICSVVAVVTLLLFLVITPLFRSSALPVDPVAQGAASAFDVATPAPDVRAVEPDEAGIPQAEQALAAPAPEPLAIQPADLTPPR
jgi:hypothetical protein